MPRISATVEAPEEEVDRYLDVQWRLRNLYTITDERGRTVPFKPNGSQERLLDNLHNRNLILKARQLGFCLDPSTRVLKADMTWVRIDSLHPGDRVVAVDEYPVKSGKGHHRRMRTAVIQAAYKVTRQAYRIDFDDGRSVVCTGKHPWLSSPPGSKSLMDWRKIEGEGKKRLKVGSRVRWITKPWSGGSFDDGWFGGLIDGEGSMAKGSTTGAEINVSQREGDLWRSMVDYASRSGYSARIEIDNNPKRPSKFGGRAVHKLCFSRMDELLKLIGQTRPKRFVGREFWEGKELPGKRTGIGWSRITKIEKLGVQTMVDLQTSTGTYIAEGFVSHNTTLAQIIMLDQCLWIPGTKVGMVAHRLDDAKRIFREKAMFAYHNLPDSIKAAIPLTKSTSTETVFANGSTFFVGTSLRSGTYRILHISEHGKICAQFPEKAREVKTGTLPTVPPEGYVFIESTAEGQHGDFFEFCEEARNNARQQVALTSLHYRFHFYPWFNCERYTIPDAQAVDVPISEKLLKYFDALEDKHGIELTIGQRAWYALTAATQHEDTKREFPTLPDEAFEAVVEGAIYGDQIEMAIADGRIGDKPPIKSLPVYTFWDIGIADHMAIWMVQFLPNAGIRLIASYACNNVGLEHYTNWLWKKGVEMGVTFRGHVLPHDGANRNPETGTRFDNALIGLTGIPTIVMKATDANLGINEIRNKFPFIEIDATNCEDGLRALKAYQWDKDDKAGLNKRAPKHNWASHRADALRTMAFFSRAMFNASSVVKGGF